MERLVINVPEEKSKLVKQILKELGVIIQTGNNSNILDYKRKLTKVSIWSNEDFLAVKEGRESFEKLKPQKW